MKTTRITCTPTRGHRFEWFAVCMQEPDQGVGEVYLVPWRSREDAREGGEVRRVIQHAGTQVLLQVRVWRSCKCGVRSSLPQRVLPGDRLQIAPGTCFGAACGEGEWWVRWFDRSGRELVWPFVW